MVPNIPKFSFTDVWAERVFFPMWKTVVFTKEEIISVILKYARERNEKKHKQRGHGGMGSLYSHFMGLAGEYAIEKLTKMLFNRECYGSLGEGQEDPFDFLLINPRTKAETKFESKSARFWDLLKLDHADLNEVKKMHLEKRGPDIFIAVYYADNLTDEQRENFQNQIPENLNPECKVLGWISRGDLIKFQEEIPYTCEFVNEGPRTCMPVPCLRPMQELIEWIDRERAGEV